MLQCHHCFWLFQDGLCRHVIIISLKFNMHFSVVFVKCWHSVYGMHINIFVLQNYHKIKAVRVAFFFECEKGGGLESAWKLCVVGRVFRAVVVLPSYEHLCALLRYMYYEVMYCSRCVHKTC